ncbi:MAG: hypothetical protein Q4C66_09770 [Lachnospiraceae bacterium]|nr:hypothetical protein [Lachnospiraceae bacterium]
MDMLFFFAGCLGLAETVDLFFGKDFLIFMGNQVEEKDYDLEKLFRVEKWLFVADTIGCFILTRGSLIGFWGQMVVILILLITLVIHGWAFNNEKFMTAHGLKKKQQKKEARIAWRNRKKK